MAASIGAMRETTELMARAGGLIAQAQGIPHGERRRAAELAMQAVGLARQASTLDEKHRAVLADWLVSPTGVSLARCGRTAEAVRVTEEAVAILEDLVARFPDNADHLHKLSWALINLAQVLWTRHEYARADEVALSSVALMRKLIGREPQLAGARG